MINNDPIGTARREQKRIARLGPGPHVCFLCGYCDPVALVPVTCEWLEKNGVPRTLFEGHHVVGRNNDSRLIQMICRNCHAKAGEGLLRAGISMRPEPDPNTREVMRLEGLASFHEQIAASLREWAAQKRNGNDE